MAEDVRSCRTEWSRDEEEAFENAVADYHRDCSRDRWDRISAVVPWRTVEEVKHHYAILVEDVSAIEAGLVPLPNYVSVGFEDLKEHDSGGKKDGMMDKERRRGIQWTMEEHSLFLQGLAEHGKGDWRSISRNWVISRTPTQVASHAQKYFNRLTSTTKDRRRTSIHDITTLGTGETSASQGPITGQANGWMVAPGESAKQSSQPSVPPGIGTYEATVGQAVDGTPGNPTLPSAPHMIYPVPPPIASPMVPRAPANLELVNYPMPQTSST